MPRSTNAVRVKFLNRMQPSCRSSARLARLAVLAIAVVIACCIITSWSSVQVFVWHWAPPRATWTDFKDRGRGVADVSHPAGAGARRPGESPRDFARVTNRTLGFEKVMAIGLPERSDKRDALDLMAALSGFTIDWVDGVRSSSISDKAVPFGIDVTKVHDNFLGSWRGHMNAIRRIVQGGISSALILEDDMDWDVHLKSQLYEIAHGARHIYGEPSRFPNSPYGDAWDILWLGHCGEPFPETLDENSGLDAQTKAKMSAKYAIKDDDTVPPYAKVSNLVDWSAYAPRTRLVHMTAAPICSFAYAVSQTAARKILYALSVDGLHMAFDNSLAQLCRDAVHDLARAKDGGYRLKCLSVNPTIMFHHKAKGRVAGDSDIQSHGKDGGIRNEGTTESIKWSARLNLKNILTGRPLQPQFGDDEG